MVEPLLVMFEDGTWSSAEFLGRSLDFPLASESEFWLVDEGVGEVISIGSPEAGGDILMVGVGIGTIRAPIDSLTEVEVEDSEGRVSVLTAMWAVAMVVSRGAQPGQDGECRW